MSDQKDVALAAQSEAPRNPFQRQHQSHGALISAGAVAIEQERAIAEAQGKMVIAKRFPRDRYLAYQAIMEACSRLSFAEDAVYAFPRGGQTVSGPSIRLAEELARCWGNIEFGVRELSRRDGESEMEAYAWDLETNAKTAQTFTVKHLRDKKASNGGQQVLTDERDIYEIGANMGARRMRARLLAILPSDIVEDAVRACRETLKRGGEGDTGARLKAMLVEFGRIGVKVEMIESRFGKKIDALFPEEMADLRGIFKSIRDGHTKAAEWFGDEAKQVSGVAGKINAKVKAPEQPAAAEPGPELAAADAAPEPADPTGGF